MNVDEELKAELKKLQEEGATDLKFFVERNAPEEAFKATLVSALKQRKEKRFMTDDELDKIFSA